MLLMMRSRNLSERSLSRSTQIREAIQRKYYLSHLMMS